MDSKIYNAYKTVLESQHIADEDEQVGRDALLKDIASGLKNILDSIESYLSKSSSLGDVKRIKLPDNPEDTSWMVS